MTMWYAAYLLVVPLLSLHATCAAEQRLAVTPVAKVVQLLTRLRIQVQEEGKGEAVAYDKYACFCKDQADQKVYVIQKSDEKIEQLKAAVEELSGRIEQLDADVVDLKKNVDTEQTDAEATQKTRTEEQDTYESQRQDLKDAVQAVTDAIASLKNARADVRNVNAAAALLATQRSLAKLPARWATVSGESLALLAAAAAPAGGKAPAYEHRSSDIIATLQGLSVKFKADLAELDTDESKKAHDFGMIEGARANKVKAFQSEIDLKEKLSAEKSEEKSETDGLLADEETSRKADQEFLDELTASCDKKAQQWDQRSQGRAAELTAMTEAIGILNGMGDAYSANKKLVGLAQQPAFLQVARRHHAHRHHRHSPIATFLERKAKQLQSPMLLSLAAELKLGGDHFEKVRALIKDLIAKLEADAADEATAKSVCDEQMTEAVGKRDKQAGSMESGSASISATSAAIKDLKGEVAALSKEIAGLNKALNEMTELRGQEKTRNEKTIADATAGSEALANAIAALETYYGASLLQAPDREGNTVDDLAPGEPFADEEYKGKATESKGIMGLLEVIKSDFDRTIEATGTAETDAEADFKTESGDIDGQLELKKGDKSTKEGEVETKESEITGFKDDLKDATTLHADALEQLEKLQASCVDTGETWEERKKHRLEEIEALKQAMKILEEWQG